MALPDTFLVEFTKRVIAAAHYTTLMAQHTPAPIMHQAPEIERIPGQNKIKLIEIDALPVMHIPIQKSAPKMLATPLELELGRISTYINNPAVLDIECSGPEKPLVIKEAKGIQNTTLLLKEEEIQQIINEVARLSATSVQNNILRASYQGIEFTGIISESVGSRFIVHKKIAPQ